MPTFVFTSPEGKQYKVNGPEGATEDQAWEMLQGQLTQPKPQQQEATESVPSNMQPDGVGGLIGAIPQTVYNLGVGAAGAVAGGAKGIYKLLESGMNWDQASAAVQSGMDLLNKFRIEKSQAGLAIEEGIGNAIEGAEGYVASGLEGMGMDPAAAKLTAKLSVEGGLAVAPVVPKAARAVGRGIRGIPEALARSVAEPDAPWIGKPMAPGEGALQGGGPVQRVVPPPIADRVAMAAEQRLAQPVPPAIAPAAPIAAQEAPVERPVAPVEMARAKPLPPEVALTKREIAARDNTPFYKENALSNVIDSPMLRALKVTGGENNPFVAGLRKLETDTIMGKQEFIDLETKYGKAVSKLGKSDRELYKSAILEGDSELASKVLTRSPLVKNTAQATELMREVNTALDKRYADVVGAGVEQKYVEGFHPRNVNDPAGLAKAFEKMLLRAKSEGKHTGSTGLSSIEGMRSELRKLTNSYKDMAITPEEYTAGIDKLLKADVTRKVFAPKGSHSKNRAFQVVPKELQKYYADPHAALSEYFNDTSRVLAERKFLGADPRNLEAGIASRISNDAATGRFSEQQLVEMKKILQERFNPKAQQAPAGVVQNAKNVGYAGTIANVPSAAIQMLDIIPATMRYGPLRALGGAVRHITGGKSRLDPLKLGLYETAHELEAVGGKLNSHKVLNTLLKTTGFKAMDRLGKGTVLNAARSKAKSLASSKKGIANLEKRGWKHVHGGDWDNFVAALKKGDWDNPYVQEFAIAELLEVQPISLSSMPISYLRSPNGRVFYMLKTWAIRQLNAVREAKAKGNNAMAGKLASGIVISNMLAGPLREEVKELINSLVNREPKKKKPEDMSDQAFSALLRTLFMDRFSTEKALSSGKAGPILQNIVGSIPAADMVIAVVADAIKAYEGNIASKDQYVEKGKSFRYIPGVGPVLGGSTR